MDDVTGWRNRNININNNTNNNNNSYSHQHRNNHVNADTMEIIELCLKLNPNERITPHDVYFHRYFDEFERKYERKH